MGVAIQGVTRHVEGSKYKVVHDRQDVLQSLSSLMDDCNVCGKQWKLGHKFGRGRSHSAIRLDATEQEPE